MICHGCLKKHVDCCVDHKLKGRRRDRSLETTKVIQARDGRGLKEGHSVGGAEIWSND